MIVIRRDQTFTKDLINKLVEEYSKSKRVDTVTHVSDIITPPHCIRQAFYARRFPEDNVIDASSVGHFIRGQASEYAITKLAPTGISQLDVTFSATVKGHPDIASKEVIYELKDTTHLSRLTFEDYQFKSYLKQLLYYMVMTNKDKGIISIKYNTPELILQRRITEGELYLKPYGSRPDIESWDIYLAMDDPQREELKKEIVFREGLFQNALKTQKPDNLPRLPSEFVKPKCTYCPYKKRCDRDPESESAVKIRQTPDILDVKQKVNFEATPAPVVF